MTNSSKDDCATSGSFPRLTLKAYRGLYDFIARYGKYYWYEFTLDIDFAGIEGCIDVYFQYDHYDTCTIRAPGQLEIAHPECANVNLMLAIRALFTRINKVFG